MQSEILKVHYRIVRYCFRHLADYVFDKGYLDDSYLKLIYSDEPEDEIQVQKLACAITLRLYRSIYPASGLFPAQAFTLDEVEEICMEKPVEPEGPWNDALHEDPD